MQKMTMREADAILKADRFMWARPDDSSWNDLVQCACRTVIAYDNAISHYDDLRTMRTCKVQAGYQPSEPCMGGGSLYG